MCICKLLYICRNIIQCKSNHDNKIYFNKNIFMITKISMTFLHFIRKTTTN
jgi:hypothetical protein